MLTRKYRPIKSNCMGIPARSSYSTEMRKSSPIGPIVASMLGVIVWLVFILFYALFWSSHFSLFQNIVVFIASLCITVLLIGIMWIVWGSKYRMWAINL